MSYVYVWFGTTAGTVMWNLLGLGTLSVRDIGIVTLFSGTSLAAHWILGKLT
jgi:hypothetical protein